MAEHVSRRTVLFALGAGAGELLLERDMLAANVFGNNTGEPGLVNLTLTALGPGSLRIGIAPVNAQPPVGDLGVVEQSHPIRLEAPGAPRTHTVDWGRYTIEVKNNPLRIAVSDKEGRLRQEIRFDTDSTAVHFSIGAAPLFGFGEGVHPFDRRGTKEKMISGQQSPDLRTYGARVRIPWLISADGWGLFIGQPAGNFDLSGDEGSFNPAEATSTRNVYLLLGDTPAEILHEYAELTGFPHLPPLWAFGFQQSHRTLASKQEVMSIAKTFRDKKLPCDALIYLGTGFCPSGWNTGHGSFTFNSNVFPDPKTMLQQLHDEHFKVIVHVVPPGDFHGKLSDTGEAAESPGDAVTYWSKHVPVDTIGVDGWWPDEGDMLSTYAKLDRNQMYWDGPLELHPERRPFALHRNGYAGLQRFGWLWSGDTASRWTTLAAQVMVGINAGLCGIPYWGSDIGGFIPTRELTPELYVRWFQFSSFCPSFRAHGVAWHLRLPWGWDLGAPGPLEMTGDLTQGWPPPEDLHRPDVEEICRKYLDLRYQLLPYLYSSAAQTHATGLPLMRSLWISYPRDVKAALVDDSYMWGDHILVAPVLEKGATQRTTYLPAGTWWDYWSNKRIDGGQETTRKIDLLTMPLYVRAGAVIPFGPVKQHTAQESSEPITLMVYPGADGKSSWYEDDGTSFGYEKGAFTQVECAWNERDRILTLSTNVQGKSLVGRTIQVGLNGNRELKTLTLRERISTIRL